MEESALVQKIKKYVSDVKQGFLVAGIILTVVGGIFLLIAPWNPFLIFMGIPMVAVGVILIVSARTQTMHWEMYAQLLDNTDKLVYFASKTASKNDPEE